MRHANDRSLIMIQNFKIVFLVLLTCVLTSCNSRIKLNEYFNNKSSFTLTINSIEKSTGLTQTTQTEIEVISNKYSKLIEWLNKNESGWQMSAASFVTEFSVSQGSFKLLYTKGTNGAIISFIDKENKPRQYSKSITKGELDFLVTE